MAISVASDPLGVEGIDAWQSCNYSVQCLYRTYNFVLATSYLFATPIVSLAFLLLAFGLVVFVLSLGWSTIRDFTTLKILSMRSDTRPASVDEVIERLGKFKIDWIKSQYVRAVQNWLPISTEWDKIIAEAGQQKGATRDELYKLAELWQDSTVAANMVPQVNNPSE